MYQGTSCSLVGIHAGADTIASVHVLAVIHAVAGVYSVVGRPLFTWMP
jgi:hypothetical protein